VFARQDEQRNGEAGEQYEDRYGIAPALLTITACNLRGAAPVGTFVTRSVTTPLMIAIMPSVAMIG
jgi:hypothetical protein